MKLIEESTKITYKKVPFSQLNHGDVFKDGDDGSILIKISIVSSAGTYYNTVELSTGLLARYNEDYCVYPLEATLYYEMILEKSIDKNLKWE